MIVVDASVLVKALFREDDTEAALSFLQSNHDALVAPDLLWKEAASAVVRDANSGVMQPRETGDLLQKLARYWRDGLITSYELTPDQLLTAAQLALRIGHPLADCIYLGLALDLDCELVTADARFHRKALKGHPSVRLLADVVAG